MYPVIFKLGFLQIYSYGLFVALGFVTALLLARFQAKQEAIPSETITNLVFGLIISGILGARLFYILQNLKFYRSFPSQIFMLHKGGLSFYGGFMAATVYAAVFLKKSRLPFAKVLDLVCPYLALAQAIGRIGCFLNGCCYGKPTDTFFGIYFPGQNIARHPVQIYSSVNLLLIFIILRAFQVKRKGRKRIPGQTFLLYCLLYSIMRFFMEYLRGDNLAVLANLTIHQVISLGIFIISGILLYRQWKNSSLK